MLIAAVAGLKKRPPLSALGALTLTFTIYYAAIAIFGPVYTEVCSKDKNGNVGACENWDIVTAIILRSLSFLDEHNGLVAAFAGVAVAVFTGVLWWSTEKLWASSMETSQLAERQFLLTARQADLAEKQHGLARLQHIATHRPRLKIRSVVINSENSDVPMIQSGCYIIGSLVVTNSGATEARILDSGYRFFWSNAGLPMQPPLDGEETKALLVPQDPLAPYESRWIEIKSHTPFGEEADRLGWGVITEVTVYLMGFIRYADIEGAERFMGFCRAYQPPRLPFHTSTIPQGRFVAVNNGDYEYED